MKIVVATGGFDPVHSGHIAYLTAAKKLGDVLYVGVNSDFWLCNKKGRAFMPFAERAAIVESLKPVDRVLSFVDDDLGSACNLLNRLKQEYPYAEIIFANGGDRTSQNIPEMSVQGVQFAFGIGGNDKANSSSWILEEWKSPKTERPWGYYRVLHEVPGTKVKELTVMPGESLSMQRHQHRNEYWHVAEGKCLVNLIGVTGKTGYQNLNTHDDFHINSQVWHQLTNPHTVPCKIVEVQYGSACDEDDIERKE